MPLVTRRRLLGAALASIAGGAYLYARLLEPRWLEVCPVDLTLPRLPDAFAGFKIAQLSDLHFGPWIQPEHMEPAIDAVLAWNPDAIVITGDLVSRVSDGETDMIVQSLSRLRAPQGVFAILGNHDWWTSAAAVRDALQSAGVTVLCNQHQSWRLGSQSLYLAGLDDVMCGKHDLTQALQGIPPDAAVIVLVHEPDYADTVARDSRVLLQLSGHSHGGQVRVPFCGGVWYPPLARKYPMGLYTIDDLTLYTNRGAGIVSWQARFACRPEVTLHTLQPAR
jgi:predicted MPP superfamily phosphohydrolase